MGGSSTASSSASSDSSNSTCSSDDDDSSSSSSSSSSTSSSWECPYVHIDKNWCPGTTKLREIAREVAEENDCPKYSQEIRKEVLERLEERMEDVQFFRTVKDDDSSDSDSDSSDDSSSDESSDSDSDDDSDNNSDDSSTEGEYGFGCFTEEDDIDADDEDEVEEIPDKKLHKALKPFYDGERYLLKKEAHVRDVYFDHPNHPGTQAFVRASQQLVVRLGVRREYDERTYKRMLKLLYDSDFFVGTAPRCKEADEEDLDRIFEARYEFDREMIRKLILENRKSRPIPGTVFCKCSCCQRDPNKETWVMKLLGCLPKAIGLPVLGAIAFVAFGFLYFVMYYLFKVILTTIYVVLGVSISFLIGGEEDDGEEVKEEVEEIIEEAVNTTVEEIVEVLEGNLRNRW